MGAFGELLIKTWGGDLDHYRGNDIKWEKTTEPAEEEIRKSKIEFAKRMKIDSAKHHLDLLTDNIMYKFIDHTKITEEHFKNSYRKINTEEWVIDLMWNEYTEFLVKYVIKNM